MWLLVLGPSNKVRKTQKKIIGSGAMTPLWCLASQCTKRNSRKRPENKTGSPECSSPVEIRASCDCENGHRTASYPRLAAFRFVGSLMEELSFLVFRRAGIAKIDSAGLGRFGRFTTSADRTRKCRRNGLIRCWNQWLAGYFMPRVGLK